MSTTPPPSDIAIRPSRWRVVLVRLPEKRARSIAGAFPGFRMPQRDELPKVVQVTPDLALARLSVERLRSAGAVAVLVEEPQNATVSAFCPTHPPSLASIHCERCASIMCARCMLAAEGRAWCATCNRKHEDVRQRTRTRQLFSVFLFAVFLYQVAAYTREDKAKVNPDKAIDIALMQFVEPGVEGALLIKRLNGEVAGHGSQDYQELESWFNSEKVRYLGKGTPPIRIHVYGPWPENLKTPPMPGPTDGPLTLAWRGVSQLHFYKTLGAHRGVDASSFGVHAYVLFAPSPPDVDLESHSFGSEKGRLAVTFISVNEPNPAYALTAIGHEICHALGAVDTYLPGVYRAAYPEGFVEPNREPLYPQQYAEVMAADIPLSPTNEGEVRHLAQLRIGHATAAHMGWLDPVLADRFYHPTPEIPLMVTSP